MRRSTKTGRLARALTAAVLAASLALSPLSSAATAAQGATTPAAADGVSTADGASTADGRAQAPEDSDRGMTASDAAAADDGAVPYAAAAAERAGVPAPPSTTVTSGCFLRSDPNRRYSTLVNAINAAQDGDVIYVASDNIEAGGRAVSCDKDLTITSVYGKSSVSVPYNFAYAQTGARSRSPALTLRLATMGFSGTSGGNRYSHSTAATLCWKTAASPRPTQT